MTTEYDNLAKQARALSPQEKATLVRMLIQDLDNTVDADVEASWIEEAERRYAAYRSGEMEAIPGDEAIQSVRQRLR